MVAFKIVDVKDFMNKLLIGEVFDNFLLVSFEISSFAKVTIDGVRNEAWYEDSEGLGRYLSWKELRNKVSLLVKGDRIPLAMTFRNQYGEGGSQAWSK